MAVATAQYEDVDRYTPVSVEWLDAHGADEGWQDEPPACAPLKVITVGQFWEQNEKGVMLVFSAGSNDGKIGCYLFIPRVCITRFNRLRIDRIVKESK